MMDLAEVKERLRTNLSGGQIANVLNRLLRPALWRVQRRHPVIRQCMAEALAQALIQFRRKLSSLEKQDMLDHLFSSVVCADEKRSFHHMLAARLNRSILAQSCEAFVRQNHDAVEKEQTYLQARASGAPPSPQFVSALASDVIAVRAHLDVYSEFRSMVAEKYYRLAHLDSKSVCSMDDTVSHLDLRQNFVMSIPRAIDRYDPDCGALASFIRRSFKNAHSSPEFDPATSVSFTVSQHGRRRISDRYAKGDSGETNFAYSLESTEAQGVSGVDTVEDDMVHNENVAHLLRVIDCLGDITIARLVLDLPFSLTALEIAAQKQAFGVK
jgi:hypothetical protein